MKATSKQLLVVLAVLVFLYVMALPAMMGGFGYGAEHASRSASQPTLHYTHSVLVPAIGGSLAWTGRDAVVSGLLQLSLLVVIVLGSVWLVAGAASRRSPRSN